MDISDLSRILNQKSRSISAENPTGEPGMGARTPWESGVAKEQSRELGIGWKVNPYVDIQPGQNLQIALINAPGRVTHIWMTPTGSWRDCILRMYWDNQQEPSVECPIGDFFCMGWGRFSQISSAAVCVNPASAFNCYWDMPFRQNAKITVENRAETPMRLYYQIDYCLCDISDDAIYFHAQFRRVNPLPYKEAYTILDSVSGRGQYVGTYMSWGSNNSGWWGEGEMKFYMDEDAEYPTICGTGTEDYFCGSYNFEDPARKAGYIPFTSPYSGLQVVAPDGLYQSQTRFGLYRWHITDPICFDGRFKATIQALGWRSGHRYLPLRDDISSVAYWYQTLPANPFPALPDRDYLEI